MGDGRERIPDALSMVPLGLEAPRLTWDWNTEGTRS